MSSTYTCKECGAELNLITTDLFPPEIYFEAGNNGTLSFSRVDPSKLRFEKEDKFRLFFETLNYWGIHRNRTKIKCHNCGRIIGHIYADGPPSIDGYGHLLLGPSQVIPRISRYRFKIKALLISSDV